MSTSLQAHSTIMVAHNSKFHLIVKSRAGAALNYSQE